MSSSGGGGGDSKDSANREMQSFDGSTAGTDTDASEERDDGESRKRKATEPPTEADEAAATATLLSMPQNISKANSKKENNVSGDMSSSRDNRSFGSSDHDLSTIEGQQALNPNMSIDQARFQAKREYNRLNAARARIRNKEMLEELHGKVAKLSKRAEDLERENEILRAQVKVLTAQQQNQQQQQVQKQQQQQQQQEQQQQTAGSSQQQQPQIRSLDGLNQNVVSRNQPDTLTMTLLNVLQGGGGAAAATATQSSVQNNQHSQFAANPLAQLFPGLQSISGTNMRSPAPSVPDPAQSTNPLDSLGQLLKNLQNQQQQQQQALRMPPQQAPPTDLQGMLNLLMGKSTAAPAPSPPTSAPAFPPGLAAFGQSVGLNENFLKEFLAQQQTQQQQQQQSLQHQQQQRTQDGRSLTSSLTGEVTSNSNAGAAMNPSALAEILAKADPLTRQNVLNMIQNNPLLGQSIFAQLDSSKNTGSNQRQHQQPSPAMHSMANHNDGGSLSARSQTGGDSSSSNNISSNKNGFSTGMNGFGEQLNPQSIPGRDQLNQLLPTLSPKTLYSILKQQQPDSQEQQQQQGDQNSEGDIRPRPSS